MEQEPRALSLRSRRQRKACGEAEQNPVIVQTPDSSARVAGGSKPPTWSVVIAIVQLKN